MTILNLSPDFNPFPSSSTQIHADSFVFSGGEVHVKLSACAAEVYVSIRLNNANDIMKLLLAVDALRRSGTKSISVVIPYLPYARQDRVMVDGEPLSVKVMCDLINGCGFDQVMIFDVHSEVSLALLNNCRLINNHDLVKQVLKERKDYLLVSPDAGALKKIYKVAEAIGYSNDIVLCNKVRDVSNGRIKKLTVDHDNLEGKDCYIIDDICDGGATFIGVAKELKARNAGRVNLIVSHGIMSKGEEELSQYIDQIYTTDSIKDDSSSLINRIKLSNLIEY